DFFRKPNHAIQTPPARPDAWQAAGKDHGRGPYVQADLAYAYEHITRDYPEATGAKKGTTISTVSDYFKNIRTRSVHPRLALGYDFGGWRVFSAPAVAAGLHQSLQYYRSRHCRRFRQIHQFRRITPIPQKP
ncbi:TPA: hypothetical protein ACE7G4_002206, partial [Neisseria gonorrhoeae]